MLPKVHLLKFSMEGILDLRSDAEFTPDFIIAQVVILLRNMVDVLPHRIGCCHSAGKVIYCGFSARRLLLYA